MRSVDVYLIPYLFLLLSIGFAWRSATRNALIAIAGAVASGLILQILEPLALVGIAALGLSIWVPHSKLIRGSTGGMSRFLSYGLFLILAVLMLNHLAPGFNNLRMIESLRFSEDSKPFTMYLNFDKTIVGIFILLFFLRKRREQSFTFKRSFYLSVGRTLIALLSVLIPISLLTQYVRVDLKLPDQTWIWALNNLFFVCFAEEAFFRGFLQKGLTSLLPKTRSMSILSVTLAAAMFGLAHFKGGASYVLLSSIAGLFYGYIYQKTDRIESSILVHFGLNAIHFLFLSYPALV
ncbi:MAG: CPBP family intramembrane metalloprotease [Bdellovibrionales bacterium]|nr:CPBP family intramembrane metalloprotease [Bdellovibrionales bacterium]